jgi:hypothetical protein
MSNVETSGASDMYSVLDFSTPRGHG